MASPLAVIHSESSRRTSKSPVAARSGPRGPSRGPPRKPTIGRPGARAGRAQRIISTSKTRRPPRLVAPTCLPRRLHSRPRRRPLAPFLSAPPLPSPAPRPSAAAPAAAAALGGLSLAARRSPALAGHRSQDGRGASGSCGGLEAEAEPSHSRTSGLRFPAPGCSLLPAAAMRGPVHG